MRNLPCILLLAALLMAAGARPARAADANALFQQARHLAFDNRWDEAMQVCRDILAACPECSDARILLGRVLAWSKDYDQSRAQLQQVLDTAPDNHDARSALIDVELWSGRPEHALQIANQGLALAPDNAEFLERKSKALALINAGNGEAEHTERLTVTYTADSFSTPLSSWHMGSAEWAGDYGDGTLLVRVNRARRFDKNGTQLEVEGYPKLSAHTYAYLNAGVSGHGLYPASSLGGELYHGLPRGWEVSLGARTMNFAPSNARFQTASVSLNHGRLWTSLRGYHDRNNGANNLTGVLVMRRYGREPREYVQVLIGTGTAAAQTVTVHDVRRLDSDRVEFQCQRRIDRLTYLRLILGYEKEEYAPGAHRRKVTWGLGLMHLY